MISSYLMALDFQTDFTTALLAEKHIPVPQDIAGKWLVGEELAKTLLNSKQVFGRADLRKIVNALRDVLTDDFGISHPQQREWMLANISHEALGKIALEQGLTFQSVEQYGLAYEEARQAGDSLQEIVMMNDLAFAGSRAEWKHEEALMILEAAKNLAIKHNARLEEWKTTANLGIIHNHAGKHELAIATYDDVINNLGSKEYSKTIARTYHNKVMALFDLINDIRQQKNDVVKKQSWEQAAALRDAENQSMQSLFDTLDEWFAYLDEHADKIPDIDARKHKTMRWSVILWEKYWFSTELLPCYRYLTEHITEVEDPYKFYIAIRATYYSAQEWNREDAIKYGEIAAWVAAWPGDESKIINVLRKLPHSYDRRKGQLRKNMKWQQPSDKLF